MINIDEELTVFFTVMYHREKSLPDQPVAKDVLPRYYKKLVRLGEITPIEDLHSDKKEILWEESGGSRTRSIMLHVLKHMLAQSQALKSDTE